VHTPYRVLYNWFPLWLVENPSGFPMFWTIRINFGLSPTGAGVHRARRAMATGAMSSPRTRSITASASGCCMMYPYSNLRNSIWFHQNFRNSD
jgi:hypothetical protein